MFSWNCINLSTIIDYNDSSVKISTFITQLNDETLPTQQVAISNLRRLAANERNKSIIGTAGGIAPNY